MSETLESRWRDLWLRAGAPGDPTPTWLDLSRRYSEPHRAYHSLAHVAHCLEELDSARSLASDEIAVELALWFHDAVYDPKAKDNEARSAELAAEVTASMELSPDRSAPMERLILATRHDAEPSRGDESLVVDIDLAILGQPRDRFDAYERGIRDEYSWVPRVIFDAKRVAILRSLLDRAAIYSTAHFHAKYEAAARENLRRSLGTS